MSEIKETIELLSREWSWNKVKNNPVRSLVLSKGFVGKGMLCDVPSGPNYSLRFQLRHDPAKGDLRMWTKTKTGLIQWRTCPVKGDRIVYQPFGGKRDAERIAMEDIFMDPSSIDEGEVELFKVLYGEIENLVPLFKEASKKFNELLGV